MQKKSQYAVFNYSEAEACLIDSLSQYLDENVGDIYNFFEVDIPKQPVIINIISTKKEFDKYYKYKNHLDTNYVCPKWLVGTGSDEIDLLSINDFKNTTHAFETKEFDKVFSKYCKLLIHEYAHYVNELFNKKHDCSFSAKYLVEGIAAYLSHQKDGEKLKYSYSFEQLVDLDKENSVYPGYYLTTKYFVENYDKNFVLEMFQSSRQAEKFLKNELHDKAKEFYSTMDDNISLEPRK